MRLLGHVLPVVLCAVLMLGPATAARAQVGEEIARRVFLDPANFPLLPALGAGIGWGLAPAFAEGAKAMAVSGAIGAPLAIGIQLLAQNGIDGKVDLTKAIVSGLGSTLLPLALTALTGPAAPLIFMGV